MSILTRLFTKSINKPGVYRIRNTITGTEYIGATTKTIAFRWKQHRGNLICQRHKNLRLQRDWIKYGELAFVLEVVEVVYNPSLVFERERYWQDKDFTTKGRYNPSNNPKSKAPRVPLSATEAALAVLAVEALENMSADELLALLATMIDNEGSYRFKEERIAKFIGGRVEDRIAQVRNERGKSLRRPLQGW